MVKETVKILESEEIKQTNKKGLHTEMCMSARSGNQAQGIRKISKELMQYTSHLRAPFLPPTIGA